MSRTRGESEAHEAKGGNEDNRVGGDAPTSAHQNSSYKTECSTVERSPTMISSEIEETQKDHDAGIVTRNQDRDDQTERKDKSRTMSTTGSYLGNPVSRQGTEDSSTATSKHQNQQELKYQAQWLDLSRGVIEAKQTKQMARALESNKLQDLKILFLHNNAGDLGVRAMLNAIEKGYLVTLEKLILWNVSSYDQIPWAEEGTDTIADALKENRMPNLHTLDLTGSLPKLMPPRSCSTVCQDLRKGTLGKGRLLQWKRNFVGSSTSSERSPLEYLNCGMCRLDIYSGDDGLGKIVDGLRKSHPPLKFLTLPNNCIGDEGVKSLSKLLKKGLLPQLEEVDLQSNPVGEDGAEKIVLAYLKNPLLTASVVLDWPASFLKERAGAFREKNIRLQLRLEELELGEGKISKSYKWQPGYSVSQASGTDTYWFSLHCQHSEHSRTVSPPASESGTPSPAGSSIAQGIKIRTKSSGSKSRKHVDTDYEVEQKTPEKSAHPVHLSTTSERVPRMYITAHSWGFIEAIKRQKERELEDKSDGKKPQKRAKTLRDRCKSIVLRVIQNDEKTKRQIVSITKELLMLADRKPRKFQEMFGLTRIILQDNDKQRYPAYVCEACIANMKSAEQQFYYVLPHALMEPNPPGLHGTS